MEPFKVSPYTDMIIVSITRIGIMILLTFSIPFSTPHNTTMAVNARNMKNQPIGSIVPPIKSVKYVSPAEAFTPPVTKTVKYFTTHPPITE